MNNSMVWAGVAPRSALMAGRIGSTRPMPMNAITQAKATAQTAFGCLSRDGEELWCDDKGWPPTNIYLVGLCKC